MNNRELFREIMFYGHFDRAPVAHMGEWSEARKRWQGEGLPQGVSAGPQTAQWLGVPGVYAGVGVHLGLYPEFPEEELEVVGHSSLVRGGDGVTKRFFWYQSSLPHSEAFTLRTAADWPEYKKRLQPDPARIPADLDQKIAQAEATGIPVFAATGSMMGWIRDWMGVEGMSYLMYDDRDCYADMVDTIARLVCWGLDQVLPRIKVDAGHGWEDICGKSGPLVGTEIFRECVAPGYRKIRQKLDSYGVTLYGVDSDGDVSALARPWLEAGVNTLYPMEVGTWKADANEYRRRYGREMRLVGNFDKLALERGQAAVEAEFRRLAPLMREGGFWMLPDHGITPGVSLADYRAFLQKWGEMRFN